jgi:hypothetical protein
MLAGVADEDDGLLGDERGGLEAGANGFEEDGGGEEGAMVRRVGRASLVFVCFVKLVACPEG